MTGTTHRSRLTPQDDARILRAYRQMGFGAAALLAERFRVSRQTIDNAVKRAEVAERKAAGAAA